MKVKVKPSPDCRDCFHVCVCDLRMNGPDDCGSFVDKDDVVIKEKKND